MNVLTHPTRALADAGGRLLAGATELIADVRAADKPLHPEGQLFPGHLSRYGASPPSGVPWLDEAGDDEVLVRTSRAVGTPAPLPDIHGLAIRVTLPAGGFADLLLATTAWNRVGRHLLVPTLAVGPTLSTLLPYRTDAGPVVLGARHVGTTYQLFWSRVGRRTWWDLGELVLDRDPAPDATVSFDPILHHPPGLEQYPWVTRLRERAYATARSHRHGEHPDSEPGARS
jgi:hypothetical protein